MKQIVLYGVGANLVVDVEESCARSGIRILAAIRNVEGDVHVSDSVRVVTPEQATPEDRACEIVIPIFTPGQREAAYDDAIRNGFDCIGTLVDSSSVVARSAELGAGVYVNAGCTIGGRARLGDFVIVNRSSSIGHHTRIEAFVSIGPGVVLAGRIRVGRGVLIGAGSVVLPDIEIGENAIVGAGSVVTRNVASGAVVAGNPAKALRRA